MSSSSTLLAERPSRTQAAPSVSGPPFYVTADHFGAAIVASARSLGVSPIRAVTGGGRERRAIAPALFALSAVTGAPFSALARILTLSKTDAYKSRKRADGAWQAAERAATKALTAIYRPEPVRPPEPPEPTSVTLPEPKPDSSLPAVEVEVVAAPPLEPWPPWPEPDAPRPTVVKPAPARPAFNRGHAIQPLVFRRDEPRAKASLPPVGERPLGERILEALGARELTTNTIAVILGAKELAVGDCLSNLLRAGKVTCEEFMDGHVRRRRWGRVA